MNPEVTWSTKGRSRKRDKGHTLIRFGQQQRSQFRVREYAECQCGKVFSGWTFDTVLSTYNRHVKNA